MKRRLFVAAELDESTHVACANAAAELRAKGWSGNWVAPENYHLTVAFLGGVDDARIADIVAALHGAVARVPAFGVVLDTVGAFPHARKSRVAWVGSSAPPAAFTVLCGVVRDALAALGFTFDAHADPHVTLARADGRAPLPAVDSPRSASLRIAALTLFESVTAPAGARYTPLERFALGAGSAATRRPAAPPSS